MTTNIMTTKTAKNNLKLDFQLMKVRVKQVKQHLFSDQVTIQKFRPAFNTQSCTYTYQKTTKPFPPKLGLKQQRENYVEHPPGNNFIQMLCICYFTLPCNTSIIRICRPLFTRQLHVVCLRAMCLNEHPGFLV